MRARGLILTALVLALLALLSPLGLMILRAGGWASAAWVFGLWALLIGVGVGVHLRGSARLLGERRE